jgi:hypothetical protein
MHVDVLGQIVPLKAHLEQNVGRNAVSFLFRFTVYLLPAATSWINGSTADNASAVYQQAKERPESPIQPC